MSFVLAGLGLIILLLAGDALVKGAVNLSLRLGVPAMIVSLTIVAFGTSAPELLIGITSVLDGVPGVAMGNVVGSNTANVLLVLGIPALLFGMQTEHCDTRKNFYYMIAATLIFIVLAFFGPIIWWHAIILLSALAFILFEAFRDARAHQKRGADPEEEEVEGADPDISGLWIAIYLVLGLIGLPIGAELLVDNSIVIARMFGISELVIGLTLVAIGTSAPELATTVMAAYRRQADVALGNVIGSNMFNLLAIIGVTALVGPLPVDGELLRYDLWVMLAASLVLIPFVFFRINLGRVWGVILSTAYILYVMTLF